MKLKLQADMKRCSLIQMSVREVGNSIENLIEEPSVFLQIEKFPFGTFTSSESKSCASLYPCRSRGMRVYFHTLCTQLQKAFKTAHSFFFP
jgi:hypothetical protein